MTNKKIDNIYKDALNHGALGGKLVGAGGGGFLMFYAKNPQSLRRRLLKYKINEVKFLLITKGLDHYKNIYIIYV